MIKLGDILSEIRLVSNQTRNKFNSFKVGDKVRITSLKGNNFEHVITNMRIDPKGDWGKIYFDNESYFPMTVPFLKPVTYNSKFNSMVKI